ncbi:hypothetical protein [Rhodococcoides fascians]|uniref:hypothetical protein n=1 Tax=Rhodococcoides fascians TaxID=1828 RepID=UPI001E458E01|nr:hypothetical protein [Rhodococcus fascians]
MSTAGLVDLRSDKERIARSTRKSSKELKKQTHLMDQQTELMRQQDAASAQPPSPSVGPAEEKPGPAKNATAGWRLNTDDQFGRTLRWHDEHWTSMTKVKSGAARKPSWVDKFL